MGDDGSMCHSVIIKFRLQYSRMYFFKFCIPSKVKTWLYRGNVFSTALKWRWCSQVVSCRQNINIYFKSERNLKSREIYSIFQSQRSLISGIGINLTEDPTNKMTSMIIFVIIKSLIKVETNQQLLFESHRFIPLQIPIQINYLKLWEGLNR